ncbi:MAG: peptide deformylase [Parcubacteria group bacterium Gr01-1014_18]|nr:MAG: peptide deformylase [Parcubacteria group bacterium Greene0416_36]TSC81305.1 MAG: peptide deformylase [Parcubacteria group bacterium Gr01-1014_18]TSC99327.1 MAG: peptide deformylase [Parcubacteria group bacterium Greene1014_20]TSD06836.1 MAG: peptide deformylase [Parcubacteria group bacterium Greene0714_2]
MNAKDLQIVYYPSPKLREKSAEVVLPLHKKWESILPAMAGIMTAHDGVGLAGPQVGIRERVILVFTQDGVLPLFNPEVMRHSQKTKLDEEGCLSIPETYGMVRRFYSIRVRAISQQGKSFEFDAAGLFARILQHEIDHTNGILFIDRLESYTKNPMNLPKPKPQGAKILAIKTALERKKREGEEGN